MTEPRVAPLGWRIWSLGGDRRVRRRGFRLAFHDWFPNVLPEPSAFRIVGMACFVGGVTHSPISTLVMASEMTGNYELLVPIMMAEGVTVALMRRWSHYSGQVATRRQSSAHVEDCALAALERLTVRDARTLGEEVHRVPAAMPLTDLSQLAGELERALGPLAIARR